MESVKKLKGFGLVIGVTSRSRHRFDVKSKKIVLVRINWVIICKI